MAEYWAPTPFDPLPVAAFAEHTYHDPTDDQRCYTVAETTVALGLPDGQTLSLRQSTALLQMGCRSRS